MTLSQIQGIPRFSDEYKAEEHRRLANVLEKVTYRSDDLFIVGSFVKSTSNNTPLDTQIYGLGENQAVTVRLTTIASTNNYSCTVSAFQWAGFQRANGANIALVGSVQGTPQENSSNSPTVTMVADTTNQTISVRATGENGAIYTWKHVWEIEQLGK